MKNYCGIGATALVILGGGAAAPHAPAATFGEDAAFLQRHTQVLILENEAGARVALAPAWQGRVMTSSAGGDAGLSYGWINRDLIASGKLQPHINVFGGEDRFWLGPEGGQFSIFFAPGAKFELSDWFTPPLKALCSCATRRTFYPSSPTASGPSP